MSIPRIPWLVVGALCLPLVAGAQTQYSVAGGSGVQLEYGAALMVPMQAPTSGGQPVGTGTDFPPLLVPPAPGALVVQSGSQPRTLMLPTGVFQRPAQLRREGRAPQHPTLWQVETSFALSAPFHSATFHAGGRTGAGTFTWPGPGGGTIQYSATVAQFGGPAQVRRSGHLRFWDPPPGAFLPCKHPAFGGLDANCIADVGTWRPGVIAGQGASTGYSVTSPPTPGQTSHVAALSVPNLSGLVAQSTPLTPGRAARTGDYSRGFPWTTGRVRVSQPSALGTPEVFTVTGMDARTAGGAGTLSLVSGSLADRAVSGPQANRGWMRFVLPEPGGVLGTFAALSALAACHRLARRSR